jgi:ubiquinone/menaquinone biosynthesis C-methylase UbiE
MTSIDYKHPYMGIINYGNNPLIARINLSNAFKIPSILISSVKSKLVHLWERYIQKHDAYGSIKLLRASFHDIPIQSQSIDAIFSISAIEHAEIKLFDKNIKEFERIVKPGGIILITTSANNKEDSTYDDETSGICFSKNDLNKHFPDALVKFNYEADERSIIESKIFYSRIDSYYWRNKKSFFYKKRISKLPYMPVGIKIIK